MSAISMNGADQDLRAVVGNYHEVMAKVSHMDVAAGRLSYLQVSLNFWVLARQFAGMLREANGITVLPEAQVREFKRDFEKLHREMRRMIELGESIGLQKRWLSGRPLRALRVQNEELLDLIDAFEVSLDPDLDAKFEQAMKEMRAGETLPLESLSL
jgi:hypothetical protein